MPSKKTKNGALQLKDDLTQDNLGKLYLIYGEEDYLKRHYLKQIIKKLTEGPFQEFNLHILDGGKLTPEQLNEAAESCPAMAERKVVVVNDFDLYKPPAAFKDFLPSFLQDLPEHLCLVFYYDILEMKPDKRTKIHALLEKTGCLAEFSYLERADLLPWVKRHAKTLGKDIETEVVDHLLFLCGTSMTNLIGEIEKAAFHSPSDSIKLHDVNEVCTRRLEAVVFDLTDAIAAKRFDKAIELLNDLICQKNDPILLFSTVNRHMLRLYAAKLAAQEGMEEKQMGKLLSSGSPYYIRKIVSAARPLPLDWLRKAVLLCGKTDKQLKSTGADRQKIIELAFLSLSADLGGAS